MVIVLICLLPIHKIELSKIASAYQLEHDDDSDNKTLLLYQKQLCSNCQLVVQMLSPILTKRKNKLKISVILKGFDVLFITETLLDLHDQGKVDNIVNDFTTILATKHYCSYGNIEKWAVLHSPIKKSYS